MTTRGGDVDDDDEEEEDDEDVEDVEEDVEEEEEEVEEVDEKEWEWEWVEEDDDEDEDVEDEDEWVSDDVDLIDREGNGSIVCIVFDHSFSGGERGGWDTVCVMFVGECGDSVCFVLVQKMLFLLLVSCCCCLILCVRAIQEEGGSRSVCAG